MSKPKRVAIYVRVSTDAQNTSAQRKELEAWAERAGHTVVHVYEDQGVSGAKGRDQRPQFDALLKAAIRRDFNMIAVWSSDRLGRSLRHLIEVLEIIRDTGTGLYIHTQSVDTTTPAGRAMFGMLGIFSEFEREMIVARVYAGLARAKERIARDGHFKSKAGKIRKAARRELTKGPSILQRGAGGRIQSKGPKGEIWRSYAPSLSDGGRSISPLILSSRCSWVRVVCTCSVVTSLAWQNGAAMRAHSIRVRSDWFGSFI
jgi:DNA invertase Pin-like site-specific DNA recombinase